LDWKGLTNKEIFAIVKTPTITETISLNRLRSFGHVQRMGENRIPKRVLYVNMETRLRCRPRNRWQDEVRRMEESLVEKDGREKNMTGMEDGPEKGKELLHSAHHHHHH
jgi:hypothetical protein